MSSLGDGFTRYLLNFRVDNTSPFHTDIKKKNVLILGVGPIKGINDSIGATGKKIVLTLIRQK